MRKLTSWQMAYSMGRRAGLDEGMQKALLLDAQKLRDQGVDCPDPIFFEGCTIVESGRRGGKTKAMQDALENSYGPNPPNAGGTMR